MRKSAISAAVRRCCWPCRCRLWAGFLDQWPQIGSGQPLVACCKGVDLETLRGPVALILSRRPGAVAAILTGPSFAADIAQGLPTALTLGRDRAAARRCRRLLSTPTLRLYRTDDVRGAELGGALKNVIAIAAGVVIGAGLGDSARAALMTRGYAEMVRLAAGAGRAGRDAGGAVGLWRSGADLHLAAVAELSLRPCPWAGRGVRSEDHRRRRGHRPRGGAAGGERGASTCR